MNGHFLRQKDHSQCVAYMVRVGEVQDFIGGSVYHSLVTNVTFETTKAQSSYPPLAVDWQASISSMRLKVEGEVVLTARHRHFNDVQITVNLTAEGNYSVP